MDTVPDADVDITDALVRRLLASQHPDLADLPLERADNGWDNVVYRLGDRLGVRLPRRGAAHRPLLNELRWLPFLAPRLPLPVPAAARRGRPAPGYPYHWAVVPWFEGRSAALAGPGERDAYAAQLAGFLRALHVPAPGDAPRSPVRGVPLASRAESLAARLATGRLPQGDTLRAVFAEGTRAPLHRGPALWLHGDPHPHNMVVDPAAAGAPARLAAVVDFGDLTAGDPASDLAAAWLHFTARGRNVFRAALADGSGRPLHDDDAWLRARGWAVHLGAVMALLPADDPLHAVGRHALRQVLEECGSAVSGLG